jgi:cysteine desulfurase/selenocysteine lyase
VRFADDKKFKGRIAFGFMGFDAGKIRKDFAVLRAAGAPAYFDSACMSLKPDCVVAKMNEYYSQYPACAGRSAHKLGKKVEEEVLRARIEAAKFFNARRESEIVFTRNTTEGINIVANGLGLKKGDRVLISDKEHNSNLVPWLFLAQKSGIKVEVFEFGNMDDFRKKVKGAKFVSVVQTSNLDGSSQDAREIAKIAHSNGAMILIDAAQSAPHHKVDVRDIDCDFMVCSGHKMLGPTGTGILYGKQEALAKLGQFIVGGDTVTNTTYSSFTPDKVPERFEAGLQDYAGIIGLGEAIRYLKKIGIGEIEKCEQALNKKLSEGLQKLGIEIIGGEWSERGGIASFSIKGMEAHDIALMLNESGICVRSGMHCVHSWFNARKMKGSVRASFYFYNTEDEVEFFLKKIKEIKMLAG